jgi:hypothetical protein
MLRTLIATAALSTLASTALAAAPTASLNSPDQFVEYTGAGPIGNNNLNDNNTLYWMYEGAGTFGGQAVNSWFLFFDPSFDVISGSVTFDSDILYLADEQAELIATAGFGKPDVAYDYSNSFVGLEPFNKAHTSLSGATLSLFWVASNPGDHIRVLTSAVPEPESYALMLGGLLAVGSIARRRKL